jgi:DNA invertase Pin-like site-specific DNA recombinase
MNAAIYARRSTDEHQAESLEVQTTNARHCVESKGWKLLPEHIYLEDAVSRAEFRKRPALLALLNAARDRAFDVVVTRSDCRLGGDTFRSGIVLQDLLDTGVRLFYYFTDEEVTLDGAVDKFLVAARSFAAELEREKTAQRTHEHLLLKAQRGLNVGGRVYGYDNLEIKEGGRRLRVEYRINEVQAEIIREVFRRYAAGDGVRALAKELNARGVPPPRAGKRGTGSWSPSVLWEILRRERYLS